MKGFSELLILYLIIAHARSSLSNVEDYSEDEIDKDNFKDIHFMFEDESSEFITTKVNILRNSFFCKLDVR